MQVSLRPVCPADYDPLSVIFDDEWDFRGYSVENGLKMAKFYLLHCINGSNAAVTLLVDGIAKGILILKDMGGETINVSGDVEEARRSIEDDPNYDYFLEDSENLYDLYRYFAKEYKHQDWAELRLIIVSKDCKGKGLGNMLMEESMRIARSSGNSGLFFYTDTDCNIGFYDHIGAVRVGKKETECMGQSITVYGYYIQSISP